MRTFRSSRSCTITPESISVQAQINRIEECEQHHNVQSLDNMIYSTAGIGNTTYEPSDPLQLNFQIVGTLKMNWFKYRPGVELLHISAHTMYQF